MECHGCGQEIGDADVFCPSCGRGRRAADARADAALADELRAEPEVPGAERVATPGRSPIISRADHAGAASVRAGTERYVHSPVDATEQDHAAFGRRAAGYAFDLIINFAGSFALTLVLFELLLPRNYTRSELRDKQLVVTGIVVAGSFIYRWLADSMGGTLGKRLAGVRIVLEATGDDAGFGSGIVRVVVSIASGLPLGLGYFVAAWDAKGQTWHDKAAGTAAVRAPVPMRVLAPLLLVIGSLLAAIAIVSIMDLRKRNDSTSPANVAATTAAFRRDYVSSCRSGSDWAAAGITDPSRVDSICGCVADVILAHYPVAQVVADSRRLTATDPAGYTKFLTDGPYAGEVRGCFRT